MDKPVFIPKGTKFLIVKDCSNSLINTKESSDKIIAIPLCVGDWDYCCRDNNDISIENIFKIIDVTSVLDKNDNFISICLNSDNQEITYENYLNFKTIHNHPYEFDDISDENKPSVLGSVKFGILDIGEDLYYYRNMFKTVKNIKIYPGFSFLRLENNDKYDCSNDDIDCYYFIYGIISKIKIMYYQYHFTYTSFGFTLSVFMNAMLDTIKYNDHLITCSNSANSARNILQRYSRFCTIGYENRDHLSKEFLFKTYHRLYVMYSKIKRYDRRDTRIYQKYDDCVRYTMNFVARIIRIYEGKEKDTVDTVKKPSPVRRIVDDYTYSISTPDSGLAIVNKISITNKNNPSFYIELDAYSKDKLSEELDIIDVKFSGFTTIVFWKSGDKTIVTCKDGDKYDPEKAIAMAYVKKANSLVYDYRREHNMKDKLSIDDNFSKWIDKYNSMKDQIKKEQADIKKKKKK